MKILKALRNFEFTVTGAYAIFTLICVFYMVLMGCIQLWQMIVNWIK